MRRPTTTALRERVPPAPTPTTASPLRIEYLLLNQGLAGARAFSMKCLSRSGSLRPGAASTPLDTSTPHGLSWPIAWETLSGLRPPARISCTPFVADGNTARAAVQSNATPVPPPAAPTLESISTRPVIRSEEHTSELQSLRHLV